MSRTGNLFQIVTYFQVLAVLPEKLDGGYNECKQYPNKYSHNYWLKTENNHISKSAEKAHISVSEFVRSSAMGREVTVIEGVDELLTELRRQGSNLNQLTIMA